jgi:hypothetical protein
MLMVASRYATGCETVNEMRLCSPEWLDYNRRSGLAESEKLEYSGARQGQAPVISAPDRETGASGRHDCSNP